MKRMAFALFLSCSLLSCVAPQPVTYVRSSTPTQDQGFARDSYECRRDITMIQKPVLDGNGLQNLGWAMQYQERVESMYRECMAARGWRPR